MTSENSLPGYTQSNFNQFDFGGLEIRKYPLYSPADTVQGPLEHKLLVDTRCENGFTSSHSQVFIYLWPNSHGARAGEFTWRRAGIQRRLDEGRASLRGHGQSHLLLLVFGQRRLHRLGVDVCMASENEQGESHRGGEAWRQRDIYRM